MGEPVVQWKKPSIAGNPTIEYPASTDEFDGPKLGLQWQWNANHQDDWVSLSERKGFLRFFSQYQAKADLLHVPQLLLQKFPARAFTVETEFEFSPRQPGERAGLIIIGRAHATLCLRHESEGTKLVFQVANQDQWSIPLQTNHAKLRVTVHDGGACSFAGWNGAEWVTIPVPFTAEQAEWIGARVGLYSLALRDGIKGHTDFAHFRFSGPV